MSDLKPGEQTPLNVTQEANHRIFVGLGWDPNEKFGFIDEARQMMGGKKTHHDLDLSCLIYNADKNFISDVTAAPESASDESGKIYHSGDNVEGLGDGDDEQISVELKDLDKNIHHLVFKVTVKSGHNISEVSAPEVRIADGYSAYNFLHVDLESQSGNDKPAFIFTHIYRTAEGWNLDNISQFTELQNDWPAFIQKYLSA